MFLTRAWGQQAALRAGAARLQGASPAVACREADAYDRATEIVIGMPTQAVMSRRTGRDLSIPVEMEGFDGEGALGARLPLVVLRHRSDQGDVVISRGGHEAVGVDIGSIDEMARRQPILRRQRRVQRVGTARSTTGAGVVATWTISGGWASSQVSVRWTL